MNKPQVNINLNIDVAMEDQDPEGISEQLKDVMYRAKCLIEQIDSAHPQENESISKYLMGDKPTTSRHHQSVAANNRITDAIEFINKEIRLLKGDSNNGTMKIFEELKHILLGI